MLEHLTSTILEDFRKASLDRSVGLPQGVNAAAKVGCVCSDTMESCINLEYSDGVTRNYWQQGAPYANEKWVSKECPFQGSWKSLTPFITLEDFNV